VPHDTVPGSTQAGLSALVSHTHGKMPQVRCPIKVGKYPSRPLGGRRWPPSRDAPRREP
jgi:hypothetical protein